MRPHPAARRERVDRPAQPSPLPRRLRREERTVEVMVSMYCRDHHERPPSSAPSPVSPAGELCPDCDALLVYSRRRIAACRYGEDKPTCAKCPTHCYKSDEREQIRTVMRYAGPRMISHHPYLAVRHLLDKKQP